MSNFGKQNKIPIGIHGPFFLPLTYSVKKKEMANHGHIIGKSKSGKSRFLAKLYVDLLKAGYSCTLIDPAGDLAKLILKTLVAEGYFKQPNAYNKLVYLDFPQAERLDRFMPFNILDIKLADKGQRLEPHRVGSILLEACHRAWPELRNGAANFDTLLPDCATLLINNNLPFICLHRLLTDDEFRGKLLEKEQDYYLVASFRDMFEQFKKAEQVVYAGSLLRRARQLTRLPILKYGFGQTELKLNFRQIIDGNVSTIINLGGLDQDIQGLLGCLLMVLLENAASSRAELDPDERLNTHIAMIDEFQTFSAQSEAAMNYCLSQSRKYGLYLWLAHQTWSQTSNRLQGALQNAEWEAIFRTGHEDARFIAPTVVDYDQALIKEKPESEDENEMKAFQPLQEQLEDTAISIRKQPRRTFFFRAPDDSVTQLRTLEMPDPKVDKEELGEVDRYYLNKYFTPRSDLEDQILAHIDPERFRVSNKQDKAYKSFWKKKDS